MSIFKDCDIRGIYPTEIDEVSTRRIGMALAALYPDARLRVGGDVRLSTPSLKEALIAGLTDGGATVEDLGAIPTPALYFALAQGDCDGGATVTAVYEGGNFRARQGQVVRRDILPDYLVSLEGRFRAPKPLRIVVDAGNGAMSRVAPEAFRRCGYEVVELFCEPDDAFPNRDPNPAEYRHLGAVCAKVREARADMGVAFDGDGDRAVFIDELGTPVQNEKSLTLFIRRLLKDRPTPVVYDQKSSSVVKRTILEMGGTPAPERSGHAFIKRRFLELGAAVAGEVSGHFFFGELGYDDGLFAGLMMADIVGTSGRTLSELTRDIVCPPITPDLRVFCPYGEQEEWLGRIERLAQGRQCEISHLDGVRLEFPDGWLLVRKSVTAEQITLRAEADTRERLSEILKMAADALPDEAGKALMEAAK